MCLFLVSCFKFCIILKFCVGGDAYIAPLGTNGFAGDSRKIGSICRVDVGIDPYASFRNFGNSAKDSGIWIENRAVETDSAARFSVRKREMMRRLYG